MSKHSKIGIKGEQFAEYFLQKKGYIILHRNWRTGKKEVDIIAQKGDMVIFVEVKSRSAVTLAFPEEAVTAKKQQHLKVAAAEFMDAFPVYRNARFDIVSVLFNNGLLHEIMHFEEAFH